MTQLLNLDQLKREAKKYGREKGIPHSKALDEFAVRYGYQNWSMLHKHQVKLQGAKP